MRNFQLLLGIPTAGETLISSLKLYESADGRSGWVAKDTIVVSALANDPSGKKRWDSVAADPTMFAKLVSVSEAGIERPDGIILPPRPTQPDTFQLFVWTVDVGLGVKAGVLLTATPASRGGVVATDRVIVDRTTRHTDAQGYAQLTLPSDIGDLRVQVGDASLKLSTTGRAGQVVNLASCMQ